jgi:hypothetical protein
MFAIILLFFTWSICFVEVAVGYLVDGVLTADSTNCYLCMLKTVSVCVNTGLCVQLVGWWTALRIEREFWLCFIESNRTAQFVV